MSDSKQVTVAEVEVMTQLVTKADEFRANLDAAKIEVAEENARYDAIMHRIRTNT